MGGLLVGIALEEFQLFEGGAMEDVNNILSVDLGELIEDRHLILRAFFSGFWVVFYSFGIFYAGL